MKLLTLFVIPLALLAACKDDTASRDIPAAQTLTDEAAGYYCQMIIVNHPGPKAQGFLAGQTGPLWFSQVRDGIAYLKSPEQSADLQVLYVNDMGKATAWETPGLDNWIDAKTAFYVVGSDAKGGMGAPEIVPFSDRAKAAEFITRHGGQITRLDDIPPDAVLAPLDTTSAPETSE